MAGYLLDTNHLSPLMTLGHPLRQQVFQSLEAGHRFAITVPALVEMLFGIGMLPRAEQNQAEWERLRPKFECYIPDEADAKRAATLQIQLRRRGWQLATIDALIAAVALRYNLTLLTRDRDFTAIAALSQENWLSGSIRSETE
jgi:predicted nucleic acid-binding protein